MVEDKERLDRLHNVYRRTLMKIGMFEAQKQLIRSWFSFSLSFHTNGLSWISFWFKLGLVLKTTSFTVVFHINASSSSLSILKILQWNSPNFHWTNLWWLYFNMQVLTCLICSQTRICPHRECEQTDQGWQLEIALPVPFFSFREVHLSRYLCFLSFHHELSRISQVTIKNQYF